VSGHRTYVGVADAHAHYNLTLGEQYRGSAREALLRVAHRTTGFSEGSQCSVLLTVEEGRALREHLRGWLTGRRVGVHRVEHPVGVQRVGVHRCDTLTVEAEGRGRLRFAIAHRERRTLGVTATRADVAQVVDGLADWLTLAGLTDLPARPDVAPDPVPDRPRPAASGSLARCQPKGNLTIPLDVSGCPSGEHSVSCHACGTSLDRAPHGEHEWAWVDADGATYVAAVKPPLAPQIAAEMWSLARPKEAVPFEEWDGKPDTPLLIQRSDGTLMRRTKPSLTVKQVEDFIASRYGWGVPWSGGGHEHRWLGCPTGAHPAVARATPSCHGYPMHLQPRGWVCRVRDSYRILVGRDGDWQALLDYYGLPRDTTLVYDIIAQRGARPARKAS
jgi:hypothetical protein